MACRAGLRAKQKQASSRPKPLFPRSLCYKGLLERRLTRLATLPSGSLSPGLCFFWGRKKTASSVRGPRASWVQGFPGSTSSTVGRRAVQGRRKADSRAAQHSPEVPQSCRPRLLHAPRHSMVAPGEGSVTSHFLCLLLPRPWTLSGASLRRLKSPPGGSSWLSFAEQAGVWSGWGGGTAHGRWFRQDAAGSVACFPD